MSDPKLTSTLMPQVEESRQRILASLGQSQEITLVLLPGNLGDDLILEGTRQLFAGLVVREVSAEQLPFEDGELALIIGSGGWCTTFTGVMPETLAIAELRFDRVVVLPSTFEISAPLVHSALSGSGAHFFARELESFEQIRGVCSAELAHDAAFFADLTDFTAPGRGLLNAFRSDTARNPLTLPPPGNNDISATAGSLDAWLAEIERHAEIHTDRAHVMIAGALMGKRVRWLPDNYFKVQSLAESTLGEYDVARLDGDLAATPSTENLGGEASDPPPPTRELTAAFSAYLSLAHRVRELCLQAERERSGDPRDIQRLRELLPEMIDEFDRLDPRAVDLLLALIDDLGGPWVLMKWMRGELDALFARVDPAYPRLTREHLDWLETRAEILAGIEAGNWWRLRVSLRRLFGRTG